MVTTGYDASELYPYYESAARDILNRKQEEYLGNATANLPQELRPAVQSQMKSDDLIEFGNFPLLVVDVFGETLFWKQIAHALGATYMRSSYTQALFTLIFKPHELYEPYYYNTSMQISSRLRINGLCLWEMHLKTCELLRACLDTLSQHEPLHPLFCIFSEAFRRPNSSYICYSQEDIYGSATAKIMAEKLKSYNPRFYHSVNFDNVKTTQNKNMWQLFRLPSLHITINDTLITTESIAERELYTSFIDAMSSALRDVVDYLQQKGVVTLPLSLPANYSDIMRQLQAIHVHQTQVPDHPNTTIPHLLGRFFADVHRDVQEAAKAQVQTPPAPVPSSQPASSVTPVPAPDDIFTDLENEIQRRLALKRA